MPLVVMVMTSLKPLDEITGGNMFYFPHDLTFEPWKKAWGTTCVGLTLRRHQGLRLELGQDGRSGRPHFDVCSARSTATC